MEREALKGLLKAIKKDDYKVPKGVKPFEVSLDIMAYLGDTDRELRDELGFSVLVSWMIHDTLKPDEMRRLFHISLDEDQLLYGLGETNDTVFTRAFSVLVVATVLYKHRENNFLSPEEVQNAFEKVIKFYHEDKDVRGYIDGKGWAHGAAHGADALDELARCEEIGHDGLMRILDEIYRKINIGYYGYIHEEDERMMTAVAGVLERNCLSKGEVLGWINQFADIKKVGKYPDDLILQVNVRNFLRSFYFRFMDDTKYEQFVNRVKSILDDINNYK